MENVEMTNETSLADNEVSSALDGEITEEETNEETHEEAQNEPKEETGDSTADQRAEEKYTVKVLGEEKEMTLDELKTNAQKGMDYDRIKQKYNDLKSQYGEIEQAAKLSGMSVQDFLKQTMQGLQAAEMERIKHKYIEQGYDDETASAFADKDLEIQKIQNELKKTIPDETEQRQREDVERFNQLYPDVTEKDLSDQVFEDISNGMSLIEAYQKQLLKEKEKEIKIKEKEKENRLKSVGSVASVGKTDYEDAISALMDA